MDVEQTKEDRTDNDRLWFIVDPALKKPPLVYLK